MKYLCLCYIEEGRLEQMAQPDLDVMLDEQVACDETLRKSGYVIASEALESVRTATTIRIRNGKLSITDGPVAETKEQLDCFYLIEARDLNEAIRIASQVPSVRLGSLEIRPVWELRQYVRNRHRERS